MVSSNPTLSGVEAPGEAAPSRLRWGILVLLAVGAVIAFVSRTNIASALAVPAFKAHFHLNDVGRGTLNSAFFWSYAALQIPMGWVVDRYGVKWPYVFSFVIWCIASAATGLTQSFGGLILMRVITGAGEAVVVPASYRWIRGNFAEDQSGLAVGIYMLGTKLGPAIGAPLAAWLIVAYDWRLMFIILGLVGLVWLVPWLLLVRSDAAAPRRAASGGLSTGVTFGRIIASPLVWGTIVINFCYNYFVFYDMTWMPAYLVEKQHLSLQKMGLYSFYSFMGIAIVALASGWIADVMIKRGGDAVVVRKAFVIGGFLIACTELLGATSSLNVALFWNVVSLSGLGLATANHLALCRLTLIPRPAVGLVTGVQNVSTSLAGIVAPILSGWLKQTTGGYQAPMQVIFVFLILGAVTCFVLLQRKWAPQLAEGVGVQTG